MTNDQAPMGYLTIWSVGFGHWDFSCAVLVLPLWLKECCIRSTTRATIAQKGALKNPSADDETCGKTDAFIYGGFDLEVVDQIPIVGPIHKHNAGYLATKRDKLGHQLPNIDS